MATSVPSGENAAGRPHQPGRSIVRCGSRRRGVQDAEPAEVGDRHPPAVGREGHVAEADLAAVEVRDPLAGLDVPEPDLGPFHGRLLGGEPGAQARISSLGLSSRSAVAAPSPPRGARPRGSRRPSGVTAMRLQVIAGGRPDLAQELAIAHVARRRSSC